MNSQISFWGKPSSVAVALQPRRVEAIRPFGAGRSLGGILSLFLGSAGIAIVDNSTGGTRYFSGTGPSYTSPVTEAVGTLQQRTTTTAYDTAANVQAVSDALGDITQFAYDAVNRQVSRTEAYGTSLQRTTKTAYDVVGNVVATVDALGVTTQNVYDVMNRVVQRIEAVGTPLQRTTTMAYDTVGNVVSTTNPRGTMRLSTSHDGGIAPLGKSVGRSCVWL